MQLQQINDEGQALENGLDVFVSIPVYSGEYLAYGNSFLLQTLTGSLDTPTSLDGFAAQAIALAPPSVANSWYRFHTSGVIYDSISAPSTSTNMLTLNGIAEGELLPSHSGVYQKLSGLLVGVEYQVTINFHYSANVGTISFSRFYYSEQNFANAKQTPVTTHSIPSKQIKFTFTALTTNDIVFFDYSTTEEDSSCFISSIEIKEQNDYLISVVADIPRVGLSKVLRRKYNESIPLDEGETRE